MDVSFTMSGGNVNTLNAEINSNLSKVNFPLEYHAELVGEFQKKLDSKRLVMSVAIASLIFIFLFLQAAFWSWRMALVALPSILLALSGGMVATMLLGGSLTLGVLSGFIVVLGVAIHHSVSLIKHFRNLEVREGMKFGHELVQQGVQDRLGPILMTTCITLLAFVPFLVLGNIPGLEMIFPMSIVAVFGLVTTLLLNLFVLPGLYLRFGKISETIMKEEKSMLELDIDVEESISASIK
jgi:Cu/Ag efflux pump CusA